MSIWYKGVFSNAKGDNKQAIVVDFDGTIAGDKYPDIGKPLPGVKVALQKLLDAGYEVVIYSARTRKNDGRPNHVAGDQIEKIKKWLKENDIPHTRLDDGYNGKPHAEHYIDNKALHYGGDDDWESISSFILSKGS